KTTTTARSKVARAFVCIAAPSERSREAECWVCMRLSVRVPAWPRGAGWGAGPQRGPAETGRRWGVPPLPGWRLVTDWPVLPHGLPPPPAAPAVPPRLRHASPVGPPLLVSVYSGLSAPPAPVPAPPAPVPAPPAAPPSVAAPPCA